MKNDCIDDHGDDSNYYYKHKTKKLKFALDGLTCSACSGSVEEATKSLRFTVPSSYLKLMGDSGNDDCIKIEREKDGVHVALFPSAQLEFVYSILLLHGSAPPETVTVPNKIGDAGDVSSNKVQVLERIESALVDEIIDTIESIGFGAEFISAHAVGGEEDSYNEGGHHDSNTNPIRNIYLENIEQSNMNHVIEILNNIEHVHMVKNVDSKKKTHHRQKVCLPAKKILSTCCRGNNEYNGVPTPGPTTETTTIEISYDCDQIGIRTILSLIEPPQTTKTSNENTNYTIQVTDTSSYQNMIAKAEFRRKAEIQEYFRSFFFSACCAIPVFVISMILVHIPGIIKHFLHSCIFWNITWEEFLTWVLTTPVQFYSGARFYRDAYYSIKGRHLNMGFLIAAGTSAAYLYSVFVVLYNAIRDAKGHDRLMQAFETSALLIMFVLLGKYLECKVKSFTSGAISKLSQLTPEVANLVGTAKSNHKYDTKPTATQGEEKDDELPYDPIPEQQIPLILLQKNDVLVIRPGEKVPTDGIVILGSTSIDESMLTGESMPVHKEKGDSVIGGTINIDGSIYIQVHAIGKDTALSKIIELIESAQSSKAPIQEYADWIASRFVPVVTAISVLTYILWAVLLNTGLLDGVKDNWPYRQEGLNDWTLPLLFSISCLVIACPCALGLATPTAVMVGSGVSAKYGILIKGGEALESANNISAVVFDKTGTLTHGTPVVQDVLLLSDRSLFRNTGEEKLPESGEDIAQLNEKVLRTILRFAACAEYGSEHPLAKGILAKAAAHDIGEGLSNSLVPTEDFVAEVGSGIRCIINGHVVVIGNRRSLDSNAIEITRGTFEAMEFLETKGQTAVVVSIDGCTEAVIGLIDKAREESSIVISTLFQEMGIKAYMLTGDNGRTARVVASEIGIPPEHIISDVLPEGKVDFIKKLQDLGECVAMVGDGVNDSPAMAQANVGIAVGAGTDVAIETAGIVLINSKLTDVLVAIDLSRKVFSRIKLNFVWALGYNTMAIPVAAGALYPVLQMALPPFMAAVAMILSSLSVLTSSLLLNLYKYKVKHVSSQSKNTKQSLKKPSVTLEDNEFGKVGVYGSSEVDYLCQAMKQGKPCACSPDSCNCKNCNEHHGNSSVVGSVITGTTCSCYEESSCAENECSCSPSSCKCKNCESCARKLWSSDPTLIYPGCAALWEKGCTCQGGCKCGVPCSRTRKEKLS